MSLPFAPIGQTAARHHQSRHHEPLNAQTQEALRVLKLELDSLRNEFPCYKHSP